MTKQESLLNSKKPHVNKDGTQRSSLFQRTAINQTSNRSGDGGGISLQTGSESTFYQQNFTQLPLHYEPKREGSPQAIQARHLLNFQDGISPVQRAIRSFRIPSQIGPKTSVSPSLTKKLATSAISQRSDKPNEPREGNLRPILGKKLLKNLLGPNWFATTVFKAMNLAMYVEGQELKPEHSKVLEEALITNKQGILDTLIAENPHVMKSQGNTPIYLLGKYIVHTPLETYIKYNKDNSKKDE